MESARTYVIICNKVYTFQCGSFGNYFATVIPSLVFEFQCWYEKL